MEGGCQPETNYEVPPGASVGSEGERVRKGEWQLLPYFLPPHTCASFAAGPTLQAHKGDAHSKQLLFMWKPLDLHLSFPGRACSMPAAPTPPAAGCSELGLSLWVSTCRERKATGTSWSREEGRRGGWAQREFAHSLISWTPDKFCGQYIQIRIWAAPVPGVSGG